MGSLCCSELSCVIRFGQRHAIDTLLPTYLDHERWLVFRPMGARPTGGQDWKIQHNDPDDRTVSDHNSWTLASRCSCALV